MDKREVMEFLRGLDSAKALGMRVAIASVVRVRGSAYRREGAKMLVRQDGAQVCMLSGGCLEDEVVAEAQAAIEAKQTIVRNYDLEEDTIWGLGIGCGGSVDIRIEPLDEENEIMQQWLQCLRDGELAVLATILEDTHKNVGGKLLLRQNATVLANFFGDATNPILQASILQSAQEMIVRLYPRSETQRIENTDVFFDVSAPPPELVLFGAGHDAMPLATLGQANGFEVHIVDPRPAFNTPSRFPGARITFAHPEELTARVNLTRRSYAVVMNHHLERDKTCLQFALESAAPYVGMLGPRMRLEKLLNPQTLTKEQQNRLHNPVGLDVGAESPEEVAVSIVAELLAVRRGFSAGFLRQRNGKIHEP